MKNDSPPGYPYIFFNFYMSKKKEFLFSVALYLQFLIYGINYCFITISNTLYLTSAPSCNESKLFKKKQKMEGGGGTATKDVFSLSFFFNIFL